jgi:hypothetical protein
VQFGLRLNKLHAEPNIAVRQMVDVLLDLKPDEDVLMVSRVGIDDLLVRQYDTGFRFMSSSSLEVPLSHRVALEVSQE